MPVYLYCLRPAESEGPAATLQGVDALPVRALGVGTLAAWVSDVPEGVLAATAERARAHDAVIRRAMLTGTPVPARFGQRFESEDALARAVAARAGALGALLERVRGAVEMTVRAAVPDGQGAPVAAEARRSGRGYLEWLRARRAATAQGAAAAREIVAAVEGAVGALARESAPPHLPEGGGVLTLAHLVAEERISGYRVRVHELMRREPGLRLMASGPWAPYSFAWGPGG